MESTNAFIMVVKDNFPVHAHTIESLFNRNSDFRGLCEDYHLCIQSIDKFHKEFSDHQSLLIQYEILRKQLEKELLEFIQKFTDNGLWTKNSPESSK